MATLGYTVCYNLQDVGGGFIKQRRHLKKIGNHCLAMNGRPHGLHTKRYSETLWLGMYVNFRYVTLPAYSSVRADQNDNWQLKKIFFLFGLSVFLLLFTNKVAVSFCHTNVYSFTGYVLND